MTKLNSAKVTERAGILEGIKDPGDQNKQLAEWRKDDKMDGQFATLTRGETGIDKNTRLFIKN